MTAKERDTNTRIGQMIADKMEEKGVSIRDLATKIEITYEHARRITKGESVPSKFILKLISDYLGLDFQAADRLRNTDRIQAKFGDLPMELAGKQPGMDPLERVWPGLKEEQKSDLIRMAQAWYKRNKTLGLN